MIRMIVGPECPECRRVILLPETAVRLGGIAECPDGHRFAYAAGRYYRPDGNARPTTIPVLLDRPAGWLSAMSRERTCERCGVAPATRFTATPVKIAGEVSNWTEHAYCVVCDPAEIVRPGDYTEIVPWGRRYGVTGLYVKGQRRNVGEDS